MATYKGKTAEEWRALASGRIAKEEESFQRCDTDGFVSQFCHGLTAREYELCATLAEQGGVHEFAALYDLAGRRVRAKLIEGKYGLCWALCDDDGNYHGRDFRDAMHAVRDAFTEAYGVDDDEVLDCQTAEDLEKLSEWRQQAEAAGVQLPYSTVRNAKRGFNISRTIAALRAAKEKREADQT